jgi:hypothetical protein
MKSYSIQKKKGRPKKNVKVRTIDNLRGLKGYSYSHNEGKRIYFKKE